jgi:hypothetical protein
MPPSDDAMSHSPRPFAIAQVPLPDSSAEAEGLFDIVDLSDPVFEASSVPWGWIAGSIALLLALSLAAFLLLRRRAAGGRESVSPERRAEARFDALARSRSELPPNRCALELSEALKDFLSERFDDPVRYETAEEFLQRAAGGAASLPDPVRDALREFLAEAEEVKFGRPADAAAKLAPLDRLARRIVSLSALVGQAGAAEGR